MELEKNPFAVLQEFMYIVHLMIAGKFIKKVTKMQNKDS